MSLDGAKKRVAIFVRDGGENGGPYISHMRIAHSDLTEKYDFCIIKTPRIRTLLSCKGMRSFVKNIKKANCDFAHIYGLQMEGYLVTKACKKAKLKIVLAVRGSSLEVEGLSLIKKIVYKHFDRYAMKNATVSYGVSNYVSSWEICKKSKNYYGTIYNMSYVKNYDAVIPDLNDDSKITIEKKKGDIIVASTGRIIKDKGYDIVAQIIKCYKNRPNVKFVIAGDGNYLGEMRKILKDQIEAKQVFLLGYQRNVETILQLSDIFLMCTKHETLCNSLLEAARSGLPSVATNVGGIPEIIDDNGGFLVEKNNVNGFVEKLNLLIDNENLRLSMGRYAKENIEKKFDNNKIIDQLDEVYESVSNR